MAFWPLNKVSHCIMFLGLNIRIDIHNFLVAMLEYHKFVLHDSRQLLCLRCNNGYLVAIVTARF